jgi:beta-glucosidase-like glycosyl hydrolase
VSVARRREQGPVGNRDARRAARLLFPALRWDAVAGFDHEAEGVGDALRLGVGGFCLFGGEAAAVGALTASLRARSTVPLLIASDLERGAGQQFAGATPLPPLAALGDLDDLEVTRAAGALTGREARALGVDWVFAPVVDVDLEPANPIVGTRAFGTDPARVAAHAAAWINGCQAAGALCCAKHFPGHGRTLEDSHVTLPRVRADRAALELDLAPFRAAIAAGVDAVMTAHVIYDALDPDTAATVSAPILTGLLRDELGFGGLVVSDALVMEGMRQAGQGSEAEAAIAAVHAGCDALLYPGDLVLLADELAAAWGRRLDANRAAEAAARVAAAAAAAAAAGAPCAGGWGAAVDTQWADDLALRTLRRARGAQRVGPACVLVTVDDDVGGPHAPPPRDVFARALTELGTVVHTEATAQPDVPRVVCVYADVRAWKADAGLSARARAAVASVLEKQPDAPVACFGHPRLADVVPGRNVLVAWGGEPLMQRAAARWLVAGAPA